MPQIFENPLSKLITMMGNVLVLGTLRVNKDVQVKDGDKFVSLVEYIKDHSGMTFRVEKLDETYTTQAALITKVTDFLNGGTATEQDKSALYFIERDATKASEGDVFDEYVFLVDDLEAGTGHMERIGSTKASEIFMEDVPVDATFGHNLTVKGITTLHLSVFVNGPLELSANVLEKGKVTFKNSTVFDGPLVLNNELSASTGTGLINFGTVLQIGPVNIRINKGYLRVGTTIYVGPSGTSIYGTTIIKDNTSVEGNLSFSSNGKINVDNLTPLIIDGISMDSFVKFQNVSTLINGPLCVADQIRFSSVGSGGNTLTIGLTEATIEGTYDINARGYASRMRFYNSVTFAGPLLLPLENGLHVLSHEYDSSALEFGPISFNFDNADRDLYPYINDNDTSIRNTVVVNAALRKSENLYSNQLTYDYTNNDNRSIYVKQVNNLTDNIEFVDDEAIMYDVDEVYGEPIINGKDEIVFKNAKVYNLGDISSTYVVPSLNAYDNRVTQCEVWFKRTSTSGMLDWRTNYDDGLWIDEVDGQAPDFALDKNYRVVIRREGLNKTILNVAYNY